MNTATINKLLTALNECTEWGQASINPKRAKNIENTSMWMAREKFLKP
jgi:hypothetical protein